MHLTRFLTTAAVAALLAGAAQAQTPATPATKAPAATAAPAPAAAAPAPAAAAPGAAVAAKVTPAGDIVDTAKASGQFTTFLKAAEATNLTGLLKTNKNLTVFAPTDAAFAALPAGELEKLMLPENKAQLQKLMIYHIVNAPVTSADFKGSTRKAATVAGPSVELSGGEKPMVNDATIVQADIAASNGILHVVDKVLMPGAASAVASGAAASTTAPASPEKPATPPAAEARSTSPMPKTTPPKDKVAALDGSVVQCLTQETKEMAPSPVPPKEPVEDTKAAVKDESATPPPAADKSGADAAVQEQTPPPAAEPAPTPEAVPPTSDATTPPATDAMTAPAATPGADASAAVTATTSTATMQPVADTPENRAKYKPLSNAGKRSKAKGN
ncbi:MAG: fasciclin domain-containing protein [Phenylobacterium sp.]|uniref:fasciclin domain-containing protein n=1 Tax=Phenylobacterium sp. TaxID=1871053 RepID=UPI0027349FDF|nr:fasciclin domain-containing protein [Phenylobacterium sp.]MDP3749312.1 fasciclin domain-containing protein [Phenylobacterium sp.]